MCSLEARALFKDEDSLVLRREGVCAFAGVFTGVRCVNSKASLPGSPGAIPGLKGVVKEALFDRVLSTSGLRGVEKPGAGEPVIGVEESGCGLWGFVGLDSPLW